MTSHVLYDRLHFPCFHDTGHDALRDGDVYKDEAASCCSLVKSYALIESKRQGKPEVGKDISSDLLSLSTMMSHINDDKIRPCGQLLMMNWAANLDSQGILEQQVRDQKNANAEDEAHIQAFLPRFREVML